MEIEFEFRTEDHWMSSVIELGGTQFFCVSDGQAKTSIEKVIGLNRTEAESRTGAAKDGSLYIPVNNFAFRRDNSVILVDAGSGPDVQPSLGQLPANLRRVGIDPDQVTHILLTHMHSDHANGLIDHDGTPTYPEAQLFILDEEWNYWMGAGAASDSDKLQASRVRNKRNLSPYVDRIRTVRDGEVILGCTPLHSAGHTPGHTCWSIATGSASLLAWGDTVHFSKLQIADPDIAVTYDMEPNVARDSRRRIFDMVVRQNMYVAGSHLDEPGIGILADQDGTFRFLAK